MIPKRIFYVWGVNDPKKRDVQVCIQTWRQVMPDYEIIELNEDNKKYFDYEKELKENKWFRTVYENKMWAYVADYIRIKVLYEHGGIYFDTDVSAVKPLDKFLNEKCFVGMQDSISDGCADYVEPAILGAEKGNKFLKFILDIYNYNIWNLPIYTMPELFAYTFKQMYGDKVKSFGARGEQKIIKYPDITVYPEGVFIPFRYRKNFTPECVTDKTYTIHWFGGSWVKPEILYFLKRKHLFKDACFIAPEQDLSKNYEILKLFHIIPVLKIQTKKIKDKIINNYNLLYVFRFSSIEEKNTKTIKMFNIIPLIKIKTKNNGNKKKIYLFNYLPLYVIKRWEA